MLRNCACLVLGLGGALARPSDNCAVDGTCTAKDDVAMFQMGRKGVKVRDPDTAYSSSFAFNTKPFLSGRSGSVEGSEQGAIQINEDGVVNTYYLPGATIVDGGKTVKFLPPYRFYLMKSPTTDYSNADNFYKPLFVGKTFSVDFLFGRDGPACGCNLNFYLVDMPAGSAGDEGDWYCDAQCFEGKGCCPEFDMNEGNMDVQQITNHACTGQYPGHSDWQCNKWGDPEVKTQSNDFGKGSQYTIDSTKAFTYSQRFDDDNGRFTFTTTLSQEGRQLVKVMGPGNSELDAMLTDLRRGLAFVTGYWSAPDMNWMDGEQCGTGPERCNLNPAYISNWRITSNGSPVPAPPPAPPSPNPPAPGPEPAPPAPAPPSGGKCCWGPECSNCAEPGSWCSESVDNCWKCDGGYCSSR